MTGSHGPSWNDRGEEFLPLALRGGPSLSRVRTMEGPLFTMHLPPSPSAGQFSCMKFLFEIYLLLLLFGPQSLNLSSGDTNCLSLQGCCEGLERAEPETSSMQLGKNSDRGWGLTWLGQESQKFEASLRHKKPCFKSQTKFPQNSHSKLCHIPTTESEEALLRPSLPSSRLGLMVVLGRWWEEAQGQVRNLILAPRGLRGGTITQCEPGDGNPWVRAGWCDCAPFPLPVGQL